MEKSGILAATFSAFVPGSGQLYVLGVGAGMARLIVIWAGLLLSLLLMSILVGFLTFGIIWLWNIFDAWGLAGDKNEKSEMLKALQKKNEQI